MSHETTAAASISRMESQLTRLREQALFTREREDIAGLAALIAALPERIASLRSRGYVYNSPFEATAAELTLRWPEIERQASGALSLQATLLKPEVGRAEQAVGRLAPMRTRPLSAAQPTIERLQAELNAAEQRINSAARSVHSVYEPLQNQVREVDRAVRQCERNLGWLDGATFSLEAGESLVEATEARLLEGNDETEGILFLTDRRLVFERREKEARKKILFITTASELVKELRWQIPLADIETLEASEARQVLSKRELLTVAPGPGSGALPATFRLETDSDAWRSLALRSKAGELEAARHEGSAPVPEYLVPARCPSCGGSQSRAGRIRGVATIRCEFCGATIALEKAD